MKRLIRWLKALRCAKNTGVCRNSFIFVHELYMEKMMEGMKGMDYAKESLKMHYDLKGKIEVVSRAAVDSKEALSLAYTPVWHSHVWKSRRM